MRNSRFDDVYALVRWSRLLALSLGIAAVIATGVVLNSSAEAAGADAAADAVYLLPAAGDDVAVSDNQLAVAIFLPGFFITVTLLMVVLAVKGRAKNGDEGDSEAE